MTDIYPGLDFEIIELKNEDEITKRYITGGDLARELGITHENLYGIKCYVGVYPKSNGHNSTKYTSEQADIIRKFVKLVREGYSHKGALKQL